MANRYTEVWTSSRSTRSASYQGNQTIHTEDDKNGTFTENGRTYKAHLSWDGTWVKGAEVDEPDLPEGDISSLWRR